MGRVQLTLKGVYIKSLSFFTRMVPLLANAYLIKDFKSVVFVKLKKRFEYLVVEQNQL